MPYSTDQEGGQLVKSRNLALLVAGITLAVGAVAGGALLLANNRQRSAADHTDEVSAPTQSRQVAQALASLATDPESLVASGAAGQVTGQARQAVPTGSTVEVDEGSWAPDGLGGGTITVTVTAPGKQPATYATVMVREDGRWKILATFPVMTTAAASPASSP